MNSTNKQLDEDLDSGIIGEQPDDSTLNHLRVYLNKEPANQEIPMVQTHETLRRAADGDSFTPQLRRQPSTKRGDTIVDFEADLKAQLKMKVHVDDTETESRASAA